ncbi:flippase, partial [Candidatus Uhrbacteria bacterium]|nr:flippase [Candidatus Uhrbacteria bacterium]
MESAHGIRIVKNTLFISGASIAQKMLSFLYFVFIARTYGVVATGQYFFAVSLSIVFSIFVDLGFSPVLIRETARARAGSAAHLRAILGAKILLSLLGYALLAGMSFFITSDVRVRTLILLAGIVMVLDGWHLALYAVIRGFERLEFESFGVLIAQTTTIVIGGTLIWFHAPLVWLVVALMAGSLAHIFWASGILLRNFSIVPLPQWDGALVQRTLRMAGAFALAGAFAKAYTYADAVLLGVLIDHARVGLYSAAYKFTYSFQFLPMAFAASLFPAFSAIAVKTPEMLGKTFTRAMFALLTIALPICFGIFLLADRIILFFYGVAYRDAISVLQILVFTIVFLFLTYPIGSLLNATNRQGIWTTCMGVSMTLNLVLNIVLIPRFTMHGAAIAAIVGQFSLVVMGMIVVARSIPLNGDEILHTLVKTFVAVSLMTVSITIVKPFAHLFILV